MEYTRCSKLINEICSFLLDVHKSLIQEDIERIQLLIEGNSMLQNTKDFGDGNYVVN